MVERNFLKRAGIASLGIWVAAMISACGVGEASTPAGANGPAAAPLPVEVVTPVKAEINATYHTTTTLGSERDAPVIARVAGEVVAILVEEGDQVVEGQVLARLDGERLRLEMVQAKANLDWTAREYERMVSLHERGLVSSASFEGMKYDLDSLRATWELGKLDYDYTNIRATISGVVSARDIKIGQHLDVNSTAFRVTDTTELVAHLKIPQSELSKFSAGHQANIRVDAMPDEVFIGRIDRISPTIDMRNGTFRATAYVDNSAGRLAPGMFGRFDIAYEKRVDALTIPAAAIVEEDNEIVVYIVSDGEAVRRPVTIGIEDGGLVEILDGVDESDQIVVTGQRSLRDGSRVLANLPATAPVTG
jgi:membrane fusion protein (multidrug efflux system)